MKEVIVATAPFGRPVRVVVPDAMAAAWVALGGAAYVEPRFSARFRDNPPPAG